MNLITISICVSIVLLNPIESTLSPAKKEKFGKRDKSQIEIKKGPIQDVYQRGLVTAEPKIQDIIRESSFFSNNTTSRRFSGEVLGYLTPWNSAGYENSKTFHGKFTMISPVWLTIDSGDKLDNIGTHDVQKKWLKEMKTLDSKEHNVKILPRVLFQNWPANKIKEFQLNEKQLHKMTKSLVTMAKNFNFHGYVLEMWNQFVLTRVNPKVVVSLIIAIAEGLKKHNLDVIVAVPPWRDTQYQLFSKEQFDQLSVHVKAFSLMTYDYSSVERPGPNSPIEWARQCVETLVPTKNDPKRSQILLGLNFYGYLYTADSGRPILGREYVELLEKYKAKHGWDDDSRELFIELKMNPGNGYVFYPTLYSLKQRLDLASELGTGISIWELGQGLNYFYELL